MSILALLLSGGIAGAQTPARSQQQQDASARQLNLTLQSNRDQIRAALRDANVQETSIDSSYLREGSVLPPTVDLSPVPDRVTQLVPSLRGHSVVRARDRVIFVDNQTRRVVEMLQLSGAEQEAMSRSAQQQTPSAGQPRTAAPTLSLTAQQRQVVLRHVQQPRTTDASRQMQVSEGQRLTQQIELQPIPQTIVSEVPALRGHRYFVNGQQVVIVDPSNQMVAEVIDRQPMQSQQRQSPQQQQGEARQGAPVAAVAIVFIPVQQREHWLASRFMDRTVYNLQNESIGEVEDILISADGRVQGLVLGVGGFLGIGERSVAIPYDRFELQPSTGTWGDAETRVVLRTNRDELTNAPAFRGIGDQAAARTTTDGDRNTGRGAGERTQQRSTNTAPAR